MRDNAVFEKSKAFAVRIVKLYKYLCEEKKEYVLSKQLLRSGTSIGANIAEGVSAQSRPDFYAKMSIAYKEANETAYWLELLSESGYLKCDEAYESIHANCKELVKLLASITKTQKTPQPPSNF